MVIFSFFGNNSITFEKFHSFDDQEKTIKQNEILQEFEKKFFIIIQNLKTLLMYTLKSLINEQGGYVAFLVLSEYSFIRDFRVLIPAIPGLNSGRLT